MQSLLKRKCTRVGGVCISCLLCKCFGRFLFWFDFVFLHEFALFVWICSFCWWNQWSCPQWNPRSMTRGVAQAPYIAQCSWAPTNPAIVSTWHPHFTFLPLVKQSSMWEFTEWATHTECVTLFVWMIWYRFVYCCTHKTHKKTAHETWRTWT